MNAKEILAQAGETLTARRVYGEPYERDGLTIVPAARVRGGGGGGGGENEQGQTGSGGGFGMTASPVGAYVIRGDEVRWRPAIDWTRIVLMAEIVALAALVTRALRRAA
jgi:uncharacterized spore protein YtfJ